MQGTFPFALMPFKKAVDKAHQLCQTLRMENLEYPVGADLQSNPYKII